MELSERKKKILTAVVDEYIRSAEPVGSKTIAETAGLGCSSATIRNELAELVTLGYLEQPHTSAGRIPTPVGYRMYVNELMQRQRLSIEETEEINSKLGERLRQLDHLISDIGSIASQLTNYPALALAAPAPSTIKRFDLIYIDANTFIIVAMLSGNTVKNKLVHLPVSVGQDVIQRLSSVFNANFTNVTEDKISPLVIRAAERAADDTMGLVAVIASFAIEILTEAQVSESYVSGANRLLGLPEFRDPEKAHALMSFLADSEHLRGLPGPNMGDESEVRVLIGPENVADELRDSSVIVASYDAGDNTRGIIGVVGPTRMDYSKVAAKLSLIASALSQRLGGGGTPPPGLNNKLIIKDIGDTHGQ
ncbi:MAG: heat-inducible transcriptional repressor HrcA [Oscillospiraceae bacterium]